MDIQKELQQIEDNYLKARMDFVERWARYFLSNHEDARKQHVAFINQEMEKLQEKYKDVTPQQYLAMKGEWPRKLTKHP